jgi:hypothetical protein
VARIDYHGIEESVRDVILADATTSDVRILIEEELTMDRGRTVRVQLVSRDAPEDMQSLTAGLRTRFLITYSVTCFFFALEVSEAARGRDDLIGQVELALIAQRQLRRSDVKMIWLEGGDFDQGGAGSGFYAGGEILLIVDAEAVAN